mmetsp:Transcript_25245/g.95387  ORF Transcript_25245/g.95387 Transcript_25245/m.95387 type:complete len:110 (-) Transcript_25245:218-547(-)
MFSGLFAAGILDVLILPVIALLLGAGAFMQLRLLMQTVATFAKNDMGTGAAAILTPASKFLTEAFGGRSPKPSLLVIAVIGLGIVVIIVGARIVTSLDALAAAQRKRSD